MSDCTTLPPERRARCLRRCGDVGLLANPEATASSLRDGWLWTGDVGAFDEDGFLSLKDRSKDVIISGGTNIYPREVEEVLLRHPAILECAVIGRDHPDWGEEVIAFIRTHPGETVDDANWTRSASITSLASND